MYAVTYQSKGRSTCELGYIALEDAIAVAEGAVKSGAAEVAKVEDGSGVVRTFRRSDLRL